MQAFMSEEDAATAMQQYARVEDAAPYAQTYPNLKAGDYVLKEDADTAAADTAFSRASYACVQVMQGLMAENGAAAQGQDGAAALEAGQLSQLLPMLARLPEGTVQNAIQTAASAPDMALEPDGQRVYQKLLCAAWRRHRRHADELYPDEGP